MCSITPRSLGRWKSSDRSGPRGRRMAIMRALSVFCSTNSSGESTRVRSRNIGATVFAEPLGLDIWIGLPAEQNYRVATIYPARTSGSASPDPFFRALSQPGTIQRKAFTSPTGLHAVSAMNTPENRARAFVSFGGIGSATSLAKFYAMLANGGSTRWSKRFFSRRPSNK